ncbi:unnamed protein product, partial [marine sediment metagenome]
MSTLNELQYSAFSTNSGTTGTLNEVTYAYLAQISGLTGIKLNEQWLAVLVAQGFTTGKLNERQMAYWASLGYTGAWNERYYQWLTDGGTFGPSVQIIDNLNSGCVFEPPTTDDCTSTGTYTCVDHGFEGTVIQWLWSIESGDAAIIAGQDTDTVTVQTGATLPTDADVPFVLKVIANSAIFGDVAETEKTFTQDHTDTNVAPVYIGPDIVNRTITQGDTLNPIDAALLFTGTNLTYSLSAGWPADI